MPSFRRNIKGTTFVISRYTCEAMGSSKYTACGANIETDATPYLTKTL